MTDLAGRIEARAAEIADHAFAAMYRDPFWDARFGARGRAFSAEDGRYHVAYLVEALRTGGPQTLVRYARWLQPLLTTRGMCSRHIADNFARIADALRDLGIEAPEPAIALLRAGEEALVYPAGPARALQRDADAIADRAAARTGALGADGFRHLVSYLADAVALDRADVLGKHVTWLAGLSAPPGVPPAHLAEALACLDEALEPDAALAPARVTLSAARASLALQASRAPKE